MSDDSDYTKPVIKEANKHVRGFTDPLGRRLLRWFRGARVYDYDDDDDRVKAAREDFYNALAHRTWRYSILVLVVLFTLLLVDYSYADSFPQQTYGLALDVVGAIILGRGLLLSPEAIVEKATAGYGGPMAGFRAAQAEDVADGVWGIFLLVTGVLMQGLAVTGLWTWILCPNTVSPMV